MQLKMFHVKHLSHLWSIYVSRETQTRYLRTFTIRCNIHLKEKTVTMFHVKHHHCHYFTPYIYTCQILTPPRTNFSQPCVFRTRSTVPPLPDLRDTLMLRLTETSHDLCDDHRRKHDHTTDELLHRQHLMKDQEATDHREHRLQ